MKTALYALLLSATLMPLNAYAASSDDGELRKLAAVLHNAQSTGSGKDFVDAAYISPEYCDSFSDMQTYRTFMTDALTFGSKNPKDRWKKRFTVKRIEYSDNKNRAVIHTSTASVNGEPLIVRWKAIKIDGKWLSDNSGVEVDDAL